jgi:hypothetical protein
MNVRTMRQQKVDYFRAIEHRGKHQRRFSARTGTLYICSML